MGSDDGKSTENYDDFQTWVITVVEDMYHIYNSGIIEFIFL